MTDSAETTTGNQGDGGTDPANVEIDIAEPWEQWETQLVTWSLGIGIVGLVILGVLVDAFIL